MNRISDGAGRRLSCGRHPNDWSNPLSVTYLPRRSAPLFQPLRKIHQLDLALDTHVRHRNLDDGEPLRDAGYPFATANRGKPLGNGLIKRSCRDFNGCARRSVISSHG